MQMLSKEEECEAQVTWEDQKSINLFGKLNAQQVELKEDLSKLLKQKEDIEDAVNDVMLLEEEEFVRVRMGECFVFMSQDNTNECLDSQCKDLQNQIQASKEKNESIEKTMKELKSKLYCKFGKSINLESD
eukprot:Sdes_comp19176_c1_seq1m9978